MKKETPKPVMRMWAMPSERENQEAFRKYLKEEIHNSAETIGVNTYYDQFIMTGKM